MAATIVAAIAILMPGPHSGDESVEFIIENGQSLGYTAQLLSERGLILSRYIFLGYTIFVGQERNLKAGRYIIPPRASIMNLVNMFSRGLSETEDTEATIPEGSNIAEISRILSKAGLMKEGDFLKSEAINLEGYLFPDTYRFNNLQKNQSSQLSKSEIVQEVIGKMRDNFRAKTANLFKGINETKVKEAIIIASMLEREVKTEQDMRLVSGIIQKRLKLGMPLEIDATVAYGVCHQRFVKGEYCDVSLANIVDNIPVNSVYNTYRNRELPSGPISNPGLTSIRAALNPQSSDYVYYLSTKDGTTIFSKTAAEHERARLKYLK